MRCAYRFSGRHCTVLSSSHWLSARTGKGRACSDSDRTARRRLRSVSAQAGPAAQGIAAAQGRRQARWRQAVWSWFFILFAATQRVGSLAAMAGFCRILAVNLVQGSVSHVLCVMARSRNSDRYSRRRRACDCAMAFGRAAVAVDLLARSWKKGLANRRGPLAS